MTNASIRFKTHVGQAASFRVVGQAASLPVAGQPASLPNLRKPTAEAGSFGNESGFETGSRVARTCLALLALLAATGCCSFEREWRESACCVSSGDGLDGLWEGTWRSCKNSHTGPLRAIITRCDDGLYRARFHAMFWEVLPFEFSLTMTSTRAAGLEQFQGQADLGPLAGGVYTYAGQADACDFHATYCARSDHGIFQMRRVR